jgi:LysM repeat protein
MKQRLLLLATLLFTLSMLLAACERPLQPTVDPEVPAATEVADAPDDPAPPADDAPEAPVDAATPEPETEPEAPPPVDESPRPEAPADDEAAEEGEEIADPDPEVVAPEEGEEGEEPPVGEEPEVEETPAAETPAEPPAAGGPTPATHTVARGESLYQIGLRYGISWVVLAEINNLSNPNNIIVGQVLRLTADPAAPTPTPSPYVETTHVVRPGENLFRIGLAYGLSWTLIAEANGLVNPNQIYAGQTLKIPISAPGPTPQFTHVVQPGETLFLISVRYGVAWATIAQANDIASPYVIYAGQTLIIPGNGS